LIKGLRTSNPDGTQVRYVKHHRIVTAGEMFRESAFGVLKGHGPTAEGNDLGPQLDV
jgi:hypothetical protein